MEISFENFRPVFKLSDDYKTSLEERDNIVSIIKSKGILFDLFAFKIDNVGSPDIMFRANFIAEEPVRILYNLHNLDYSLSKEDLDIVDISKSGRAINDKIETKQLIIEELNNIKFLDVVLKFGSSLTLGELVDRLHSLGIEIKKEHFLTHRQFNESDFLIHSVRDEIILELVFVLYESGTELEELQYNLKSFLNEGFYLIPIFKKLDMRYNFLDGVTITPNKFLYNYKEIIDGFNSERDL